ncbi:ImpA family type VI secretion system protein [Jiella avicenniae]|uniref:Type VI secretion system ImpA family N-terminal domain-containing protein n=1 Tax=Jiella avicenniae TaxID=2907202 RepID=A0A9X1P3P5_9HYPH|nr:type VI secretion system ImpA family N-terminal domain-containing protein [Jiella avicenniae]MCE7029264.1 type VI secretion system ImpA family N-terminal domain-containing protein [Jiella avicenniae]
MPEPIAILAPLSNESPCGPDLVEAGDPQFLTFRDRIDVLSPARLSGGRLIREDGLPFEPRDIKLREEETVIAALLARSRDLRFLLVQARLRLLAGDLRGFAEEIALAAKLLDARWEDVHPRSVAQRRVEFESFEPPISGPIPLQFVPLLRDRRADVVRFRHFVFAIGEARGPENETTPDEATIRAAIADPANEAAVATTRGALACVRESFDAVGASFGAHGHGGSAPQMKAFLAVVARIAALLDEASGKAPDRGTPGAATPGEAAHAPATPRPVQALATVPIGDHGEASAALLAAETYFARAEPSSPALLLTHQARRLIGRPLIEALQLLAPGMIASASLGLDSPAGFALDLERLTALSETAHGAGIDPGAGAGSRVPPRRAFEAPNREAAVVLIASVEAHFRLVEPSSPVPVLLARARALIGRDFLALLPELFPTLRPVES